MKTSVQVLSQDERHRVNEESLIILEKTGVRVESPLGRRILRDAGAQVDDINLTVKFPRELVESSLELVTRDFVLSSRRPGHDLVMNGGGSTLCLDGGGTMVLNSATGQRRPATYDDWEKITRLADALDEIGVYWCQVDPSDRGNTLGDTVEYMCRVFRRFSKHVQDGPKADEEAPWFTEILQTVFGSKNDIKKNHPVSCLLCPQSPLSIDNKYTEAYLALKGWNIPAAIMPMPLMGCSAPGSMISTIIQGNCEVLSMLCLLQANEPGVPVIYAPALAVMNPRNASPSYAAVGFSIMDMAATEMANYYGLPSESSPGGSDAHVLDFQNAYESAALAIPTMLSWPDIVVGPGMLDGSMVSSLEKMLIDVEIFRLAKYVHRGLDTREERWLTDVISKVGPGGDYLSEESTVAALRSDEWYIPELGYHEDFEKWSAGDRTTLQEEAREEVARILKKHEPLPLGNDVERELAHICKRAGEIT
jgi:trimethylamine--corrinoid protein Co-methyltransferase